MTIRPLIALAAAALSLAAPAATPQDLSALRITQTVRELTDDFYQGRAPGTLGKSAPWAI